MNLRMIGILVCAFAVTAACGPRSLRAQSTAQQPGIQAAFASDAGRLSDKFVALAGVMAGKYSWKPGQGVRSVGDVFNLIVTENNMLTDTLTGSSAQRREHGLNRFLQDPAKMQEALRASYTNLQKAIYVLPDSELKTPVKLFGMDLTKQGVLMLFLSDQHEHLGQSIAYARTNGVTPPWSK